jgi:hypothetical protein
LGNDWHTLSNFRLRRHEAGFEIDDLACPKSRKYGVGRHFGRNAGHAEMPAMLTRQVTDNFGRTFEMTGASAPPTTAYQKRDTGVKGRVKELFEFPLYRDAWAQRLPRSKVVWTGICGTGIDAYQGGLE